MSDKLLYQIRISLNDDAADIARRDPADPALRPLADILKTHNTTMKSVFDAFSDYVAAAEKHGVDQFPLYRWTRATIEDPAKKAKHTKVFTLYVNGEEVYEKELADALESELEPLVGGKIVTSLVKNDTNPNNNPQMPEKYRQPSLKRGYKQLVADALKRVDTLSVEDAQAKLGEPDTVFVDIREAAELEREGAIPGAFNAPRGVLEFWVDPDSPYHKDALAPGKHLILYCQSAWRSALAAAALADMGVAPVSHIEGGFTAWKEAGGPVVERYNKG